MVTLPFCEPEACFLPLRNRNAVKVDRIVQVQGCTFVVAVGARQKIKEMQRKSSVYTFPDQEKKWNTGAKDLLSIIFKERQDDI